MASNNLATALSQIAQNLAWRRAFIRHLLAFETEIATLNVDIREEVTGPFVDALFNDDQVIEKKLSNGVVFEFLYRSKIARDFVMSDPEVPNHVWEPQTTRVLVDLAKRANQVIIGGAYFGDHAILVAREIAPRGGVVHAFEPNNDQRAILQRNSVLNGLSNIVTRSEGLWNNSSTNLKLVGYDSLASTEIVGEKEGFATVTISDYLAASNIDSLDLIVVDIEGAELAALKGAERFLQRPAGKAPNIVFEVHGSKIDWSQGLENTHLIRFLTDLGYHVFALRDFNSNYDLSAKPVELIPLGAIYLEGPPHGFNMLAIKDRSLTGNLGYRIVRDVSPKLLRHRDPNLHFPLSASKG